LSKRQTPSVECPSIYRDWQPLYSIKAAFETDTNFYDFYEKDFGGLAARAASDYIASLVNRINVMYERDLGLRVIVEELSFYPQGQPWPSGEGVSNSQYRRNLLNSLQSLYQFGDKSTLIEQSNLGIVHLLTGRNVGGEAYLGRACTNNPFGVSGVQENNPKWDTVVVGHEIGHNLNSRHTHCYNSLQLSCFEYDGQDPPAIDHCNNEEFSCWGGEEELPPTGGSIMSYCDNTRIGGTLGNIGEWMGRRNFYGNDSVRVNWAIRRFLEDTVRTRSPLCLSVVEPDPPSEFDIPFADECEDALNITGLGLFDWDNSRATKGTTGQGLTRCDTDGLLDIEADIWFKWKAEGTSEVTIDTCGGLTTVDTKMAVYTTNNCMELDNNNLISCSSNDCNFKSRITFSAEEGEEYLIQLGNFPISVDSTPVTKGDGKIQISTSTVFEPPSRQILTGSAKFWDDYKVYLIIAIVLFSLVCLCLVCVLLCLIIPKKKPDPNVIIGQEKM